MNISIPAINDKHLEALDDAFSRIFGGRPDTNIEDRAHEARVSFWVEYLTKTVMLDGITHKTYSGRKVDLADHVLDNIAGCMTTDKCKAVGRAVLRKDRDAVFALMEQMTNDAIKQTAEQFAEDD